MKLTAKDNVELIKSQIAQRLSIRSTSIKAVYRWSNVYFVTFVVGSPQFVSKKGIAVQYEPQEEIVTEPTKCLVLRTSQLRKAFSGAYTNTSANSRGLYVVEVATKKEYWTNNHRCDVCDPQAGDLISIQTISPLTDVFTILQSSFAA
ncbi:MAG: hypothetical protein ACRC80_25965 [Waterburya sp.]